MRAAVRFFDGAEVRTGVLRRRNGSLQLLERRPESGAPMLDGLITGLFTDHHVHLQLVDHARLAGSRLGAVTDLGADLDWIVRLADGFDAQESADTGAPAADPARTGTAGAVAAELRPPLIRYAGPFLTAPGGYPSDRGWAPAGSVCEIADAEQAGAVIGELADADVSCVKAVAHSDAGPTFDDALFQAILRHAAAHRLPVIAHAEGAGQAQRVVRLGVRRLAHAPFTERLSDAEVVEQAASASWISTLTIHSADARAIAVDNVRRFAAAGGEVLYGTDMGNGAAPVDLSEDEVGALRAAGIDGLDLLTALAPADPLVPGAPLLLLSDDDPVRSRRLDAPSHVADPSPTRTDPDTEMEQ